MAGLAKTQNIYGTAEKNLLRSAKPAFFVTRSKSPVHYRQYIHFSNGTT